MSIGQFKLKGVEKIRGGYFFHVYKHEGNAWVHYDKHVAWGVSRRDLLEYWYDNIYLNEELWEE